jgi:hypothetical protein
MIIKLVRLVLLRALFLTLYFFVLYPPPSLLVTYLFKTLKAKPIPKVIVISYQITKFKMLKS